MVFLWPSMLWILSVIPVFVLAYIWVQRRRQKYALRFSTVSLVKQAAERGPGVRRHIPPLLFLVGTAAMALGSARPVMDVKLPSQEGTIILAIDTSGSMRADDVHPTRMAAAKAAAEAFVQNQPQGVRLGVVSFSDDAVVLQEPTLDRDAVLTAIGGLQPQTGTAIGSGLQVALDSLLNSPAGVASAPSSGSGFGSLDPLGNYSAAPSPTPLPRGAFVSGIIVLLTDGESNEGPDPADVAETIADRGVRVYTIGLGSAQGSDLHIMGDTVHVGLDEGTLKRVAEATGGAYYNAVTETDLQTVYQNLGTRLVFKTEKAEFSAGFTGLAAAFTLLGLILAHFWLVRLP